MKKNYALTLALLAFGSSAALAADAVPDAPPAEKGAEVLSLPGDARGQPERALDDLLKAIEERPNDPASALAADQLGRYWDAVPGGRAKVRALIEKVAGNSKKIDDGWAQDRYDALLIDLRLSDGEKEGVDEIAARRGYVKSWLAVGPFGWSQRGILDEVFAPELDARGAAVDLKARYETRKGQGGWVKVPARGLSTGIDFGRALRATAGACYLMAHVKSETDQDVTISFDGGSAKVFVNRGLAATVDRHRKRLDGRVRFSAHLRAGWNRIVVKTGDWASSFGLRIAGTDGHAAPGLTYEEGVRAHEVTAAADSDGTLRPSWTVETLSKETEPARRALLAKTLGIGGRGEEAWCLLEDPTIQGPLAGKAWFQLLLAETAEEADHLAAPQRRAKAKHHLAEALELDPHNVVAKRRVAELDLEDDKLADGLSALEDLVDKAPRDPVTRQRLYGKYLEKGWELQAQGALEGIEKAFPDTPVAISARARWVESKGDRLALQKLYERELELDKRNLWVYGQRRELALANGHAGAAKKALEEEIAASWDLDAADVALRRANLALLLGERDVEIQWIEKAVLARPDDLNLRENLARTLAERGTEDDRKKSLAILDDLLEVEPHRVGAQNLRTALKGTVDQFWKEWEFDARDLVKDAPTAEKYPNAGTVCLFDQTVTRIRKDGSSTEIIHQAWKVLDEDGIEAVGKRPQAGETMAIRVITPSGEVLEPIRAGNSFEMPGLAPGAVVEHEFRQEHGAPAMQYSNGPWYLRDPNLKEPYVRSRWVVIAPKGFGIEAIERNLESAGCKKTVEERGDDVVMTWETRDQERIEPEPLMPPKDEFLPWVKLYEHRTLEELAASYRDAAYGRAFVTPTIEAKARELLAKLPKDATDEAKIQAVHDFVREHVRQPQGGDTASQVLASRGGPHLVLFAALLDAMDVPFTHGFAALSPDVDSTADWEHPTPWMFSQHLLKLMPRGGRTRWVHVPGERYAPLDILPTYLWGAPILECDGSSAVLSILERGDPVERAVFNRAHVALSKDGGAKVKITLEIGAETGYGLKEAVKNAPPEQIKTQIARMANERFTGARLKSWRGVDLESTDKPFAIEMEADADHVVKSRADGMLVLNPVAPSQLKRTYGGRATRKFDLVLQGFRATRDTVIVDLGPYAAPRLPSDVLAETKFGQYSLSYIREGNKLRIERTLTFFPRRVTPSEYKGFLSFLDKVDAAERRPLVVELRSGDEK